MTLRELSIRIKGALWRQEHAARLAIVQAWNTANLTRAAKLPSLKSLLRRRSSPAATPVEQVQFFRDFASRAGLKVEQHSKPVLTYPVIPGTVTH